MQCIRCSEPIKGKEMTCSIECKFQYNLYSLPNGCWGVKMCYGTDPVKIKYGTQYVIASRLAYEIYLGKLNDNELLIKICTTYKCVNPYHYEKEKKPTKLEKIKKVISKLPFIPSFLETGE